jgi:hypothetical protein
MLTVRHIEKLWEARKYSKLFNELIALRVESVAAPEMAENPCPAAAAIALIRIDEMMQSHAAICPSLIRALIATQDPDGGWKDPCTTALAVKALCLQNGQGDSIERGLDYLADLQQSSGLWTKIPAGRMPEDPPKDPLISAFVLLQLGDNDRFRQKVDFPAALTRIAQAAEKAGLEPTAKTLWDQARLRSTVARTTATSPVASWS